MGQTIIAWILRNVSGLPTREVVEVVLGDRLRFCSLSTRYDPGGQFGTYFQATEISEGLAVDPQPYREVLDYEGFKEAVAERFPNEHEAAQRFSAWATRLAAQNDKQPICRKGYQRMASEIRRNNFPAGLLRDGWHLYHLAFPGNVTLGELQWQLK